MPAVSARSVEPPDPNARFAKMLAKLSRDQRQELEEEAVCQAKPFVAATYARLKTDGGTLFEEVRQAILVDYLRQKDNEQTEAEQSPLKQATA